MKEDLLDRIARKMGACCLSELRTWLGDTFFIRCVQEIPTTEYSLSEWTECADYLLGTRKTFVSEQ